jgi:hypothetical protein
MGFRVARFVAGDHGGIAPASTSPREALETLHVLMQLFLE